METNTNHAGGRPPKFKTPEELWDKAQEYFKWCEANPMETYIKKDAGQKKTGGDNRAGSEAKAGEGRCLIPRPYTLDGLAIFIGVYDWRHFRRDHTEDEFLPVIRALEAIVRDNQVSGAMVRMYDSNLTARINGIADTHKQELDDKTRQTATLTRLSSSTATTQNFSKASTPSRSWR